VIRLERLSGQCGARTSLRIFDQRFLARRAQPASVLFHPRIGEAAVPRVRLPFGDALFAIAAGHDHSSAVRPCVHVLVHDLVGLVCQRLDAGQKLLLVHERAV